MRLFETSTLISLLACNSFKALLLLTKRFNYCIFLLPYSPGKLIPPVSQNLLPTFNSFLLRQMAPTYGLKYFPFLPPKVQAKQEEEDVGPPQTKSPDRRRSERRRRRRRAAANANFSLPSFFRRRRLLFSEFNDPAHPPSLPPDPTWQPTLIPLFWMV